MSDTYLKVILASGVGGIPVPCHKLLQKVT